MGASALVRADLSISPGPRGCQSNCDHPAAPAPSAPAPARHRRGLRAELARGQRHGEPARASAAESSAVGPAALRPDERAIAGPGARRGGKRLAARDRGCRRVPVAPRRGPRRAAIGPSIRGQSARSACFAAARTTRSSRDATASARPERLRPRARRRASAAPRRAPSPSRRSTRAARSAPPRRAGGSGRSPRRPRRARPRRTARRPSPMRDDGRAGASRPLPSTRTTGSPADCRRARACAACSPASAAASRPASGSVGDYEARSRHRLTHSILRASRPPSVQRGVADLRERRLPRRSASRPTGGAFRAGAARA